MQGETDSILQAFQELWGYSLR